jgi:signal transduction histidine kinase
MRILLIEPDPSRQKQWLARLQPFDSEVVVASSLAEVLLASEQSRFALALSRWNDGISFDTHAALVQKLRGRSRYLISVNDSADGFIEGQAYKAGYDDFIHWDCSSDTIDRKVRHAAELETLNQRLAQAQKLESIGELAAGIAHEINTPIQYVGDNTRFVQDACGDLTTILLCCQTLIATIDSGNNVDKATEALRTSMEDADVSYLIEEIPTAISQTLEGVDRVANIVRAMKEFAHPGASEMTLTDLSHSITNTVMVARNEWKYVADLETQFDANLDPVPCLPGELNQVLLNMIVNAAHAIGDTLGDSPKSKGKITVSTAKKSPFAEIRISDTGSGISPENTERIFTPFFTTKAAGKGTGQGLAIAHSVIVEKHGGTISVESELGKGTTFLIRIPLAIARSQGEGMSVNGSSLAK